MKLRFIAVWLLAPILISSMNTYAQDSFSAEYIFEGNTEDTSGLFDGIASDSIQYKDGNTGKALYLTGKNWMTLPHELSEAIQLDKSFHMEMDFLYESTIEDGSERALIGNKNRSYDTPGFHVFLGDPVGSDVFQAEFNIGGGCGEAACYQIQHIVFDLKMDTWHHLALTFDFEKGEYTYRIDGFSFNGPFYADVDDATFNPQPFLETVNTKQVYVGAHAPDIPMDLPAFECFEGGYCSNPADLLIDNLRVSSPKPAGVSEIVVSVLDDFSDVLEEISPQMDSDTEASLLNSIRSNLYGSDLNTTVSSIKRFVSAFDQNHAPIFTNYIAERRYDDMDAQSQVYLELGTWLMREGSTTGTASLLEGLVFKIHEWFPGPVDENAERVDGESVQVNATFIKDPGYNMAGLVYNAKDELSSYVYRPTGFYAAPGEPVKIDIDPSLVNSGLYVRVGAHANDYSSWPETNRFPLISVDYSIDSTSIEVINPFGGGVYVLVPQTTDLGWVDIEISGAVRSPFYSYRTGQKTSLAEWEEMKSYPGPFADFESDKYMFSVWTKDIQNFDQPDTLMEKWNQVMDIFSIIYGRPLERVRAEAYLFDSKSGARGSYPGGYPVTPGIWARDSKQNLGITDGTYTPFSLLIDRVWERNEDWFALFHEMAHSHFPPTMMLEVEAVVNVPTVAILTSMYGLSYDEALRWSGYQTFTRDDAAIDWMVTQNFRNGDPIGTDPTTDFEPLELPYQTRGFAKYVDIADLFGGWEAMGKIYKTYYDDHITSGIPDTIATQYEVTRDSFIRKGSYALGYNIAPLMHFWGIHPSQELIEELSDLHLSEEILDRIQHYWSLAPKNNAQFRAFYDEKTAENEYNLKKQIYDPMLDVFDESYGSQIQQTIDEILTIYYGTVTENEDEASLLIPRKFTLEQNYPNPFNPTTNITFTLAKASNVTLAVFNMLGQKVATIVDNQFIPQGTHKFMFDAGTLSSGVYIYKMSADNSFTSTKKMMLIK